MKLPSFTWSIDAKATKDPRRRVSPHTTVWRRSAIGVALAALGGGLVGAAATSLFDRQPLASSAPARIEPNIPAMLAKVLPGVVSIQTRLSAGGQSTGTGMVISPDGEVLTSAEVVNGAASIQVTRYGTNRALSARLVGISPAHDLALVRVEDQDHLPTVRLGISADVPIGALVVAVGSAFGLSVGTPTTTEGIISAEGRSITTGLGNQAVTLEDLLQTDAVISSGSSGGPLVSSDGVVIGVNTAATSREPGIGFAIPVDQAKDLLPALRAGGMERSAATFLGINTVSLTPAISGACGLLANTGVVVSRVIKASPAEKAGLLRGDILVAVDGTPIVDATQLSLLLARAQVGQHLHLQVLRGAEMTTFTVDLGPVPSGVS